MEGSVIMNQDESAQKQAELDKLYLKIPKELMDTVNQIVDIEIELEKDCNV